MLKFIDRHYPLIAGLILFSLPIGAMALSACSQPRNPDEKAEQNKQYAEHLKEETVTFSPRAGVECYVIRGSTSSSPRTMSCVVLPNATFGQ